ncbi:MAG: hypothetical protein M0033_13530 [Nitrospiraceae bacterium]|nr:hypothetical protein [Nitrospiraceae bacterium]
MRPSNIRIVRGLVYMAIMAGGVVAFLAALNRFPSLVQPDLARRYDTVEEARQAVGYDGILVPKYFPEGLSWPPAFIFAQKRPFKAVVLEFTGPKTPRTALIVVQSSLKGGAAESERLQRVRFTSVKEQARYRLKGRDAMLQVGTCEGGSPCSRITWQEGGFYSSVLYMSYPVELIRIADSMIR